jgi:hypothetical protein
MAADQATLRLVLVEGKDVAGARLDDKRARLWAWSYWSLAAATSALLVYLGFLA